MSESFVYPYPYPMYVPAPPYDVTHVRKTFPEHHLPLEQFRHKVAHGLHDWFSDTIKAPRADIRETLHAYYIDVELPGIGDKKDLKLTWTNGSTLLVEATKSSSPVPEETKESAATNAGDQSAAEPLDQQSGSSQKTPIHIVHSLVSERNLGQLARAFTFPVKVKRDEMDARLHYGLLSIAIQKVEDEKIGHVDVPVRHGDAPLQFEVSPGIST